jgi:hypothetical protein
MSIKLLTCKAEVESARRLGFDTSNRAADLFADDFKNRVVIRWGNSTLTYNNKNYGRVVEFANVINPSAAIIRNCNKRQARETMSQYVTTPRVFKGTIPSGVTAVMRPVEHSAGSDFVIQKGPYAIPYGWYATEFLKTDEEYRVWFCNDSTFWARRVALHGEDKNNEFPCRSKWGYSYRENIPSSLHNDTLKAAKSIGLEFGAADVLKYDGRFYFLELNSAPSIDTNTLERFFKTNLTRLAQRRFPSLL